MGRIMASHGLVGFDLGTKRAVTMALTPRRKENGDLPILDNDDTPLCPVSPTLTVVFSGITFCTCVSDGTNSYSFSGTINGIFTVTGGSGVWEGEPGLLIVTKYSGTTCSGDGDEFEATMALTVTCAAGVITIILSVGDSDDFGGGTIFGAENTIDNTFDNEFICNPSDAGILGSGGTATVSIP